MNGFCDGAREAEERTDVIVRLTPDIPRGCDIEQALETARLAVAFRHRGVDGLGLGGLEAQFPPERYEPAFAIAKDGGLGSVPHAGEAAGPASIRGAIDALTATASATGSARSRIHFCSPISSPSDSCSMCARCRQASDTPGEAHPLSSRDRRRGEGAHPAPRDDAASRGSGGTARRRRVVARRAHAT